jgi:hypothetical protein
MSLNRLTSDGDILGFFKDGSSVGSIGAKSSRLTIGNGDTGLLIAGDLDNILPFNTSTNASRDAAVDLGYPSVRFKDLYLSGGAYLGGTAAGNHLDDYEEGTWTPTINSGTFSFNYATYVKVGRLVHVSFVLYNFSDTTSGSMITISGLPFTSANTQVATGACFHKAFAASGYTDDATIYLGNFSSSFRFYWSGASNLRAATFADFSSTSAYIYGSFSYYAN